MCGIAGFSGNRASAIQLESVHNRLIHRGPDAHGIFYDNHTGLAHNRLSIIDLSESANQPFRFRQWIMVYNGEIYNFRELRRALELKGYEFTTDSDTEVLIKGFDCHGVDFIHQVIGMFAFALYNSHTGELFLFRDRLGVKPLYYTLQQGTLVFASELKALEAALKSREIGTTGLIDFLSFGYTVGENTIYKGVFKLRPGHYIHFKNGQLFQHTYWSPENYLGDPLPDNEEELTDQLEELLISSFRYRMVSDVPVGIFFSGGVDSTALVALLSRHFGQVNTFTIGFDDPAFDETPYARTIARYFNTNHTEKILTIHEAQERFEQFYKIYDEPFYDSSGIPTSLVSEIAAGHGMKVVLSSEGGDELFGGYPSYQRYYRAGRFILSLPYVLRKSGATTLRALNNSLPFPVLGNKLTKLASLLEQHSWLDYYLNSISTLDRERTNRYVHGDLQAEMHLKNVHGLSVSEDIHPMELFMLWDIKYLIPDDFLVKVDRATMYHSIENREPFLDHRLVQFCLRLPLHYKIRNGQTKYLLRKVLSRYIPLTYLDRPKMGFSIPLFNWFKKDLDKLFAIYLDKSSFTKAWPQINYNWVEQQLRIYNHSKKVRRELNMVVLWKLLGLMMWRERFAKK